MPDRFVPDMQKGVCDSFLRQGRVAGVSGPVSEGYLHGAGWRKAPGVRDAEGARNGGRAEGPTQRRRAPQQPALPRSMPGKEP